MATNGKLTLQADASYKGEFHSLKHSFPLQMIPCESQTDKHPVYRLFSGRTELGGAWENVAEGTGLVYYTVKLTDPSFERPLYLKLFQDKADGGTYNIVSD
jgi:uncharacterized protein (DUF736 family)